MNPTLPLVTELPYSDPEALFSPFEGQQGAIWLDSSRASDSLGRYSYIAVDPYLTLHSKGNQVELNGDVFSADPWLVLQEQLSTLTAERLEGIPPFQGGVAGYWGYDLARHLERLPEKTYDDLNTPDCVLGFYDVIVSFDHYLKRTWIVSTGFPESTLEARQRKAAARLKNWQEKFQQALPLKALSSITIPASAIDSNFDARRYQAAVSDVIEAILAGDIFEANISQRFSVLLPDELTSFALYRRLRLKNAAPFSAYLNLGDTVIASASPERFLCLSGREVETRPIKGTTPRSDDIEKDMASAAGLLASEKDRAENVMIVDLMRNDLSRVCEDHSVKVPQLCGLESFSTVHHLVSVVKAILCEQFTAVDLLRATFPGGSITGAPKVRAMEIIEDIEPHRRGPYCGSVGFISFNGDMDTSIIIRTFVIQGRQLTFHVGGAIVADSDPSQEYQETLDKASAMIATLVEP